MNPETLNIGVERLPHAKGLRLPQRATAGAAGLDLLAAVETSVDLQAGARLAVPTGLILAIPDGFEGQVRPRSGLALKHGVTVANAPGTIDSDYRGELKVLLINLGSETFRIERGMRIAQLVLAPVYGAVFVRASLQDDPTERGGGGFGSTGV